MTAWVAMVVLGPMRVLGVCMFMWGDMVASGETLWGWERGEVGGRRARWREVESRRAGVSTRRIRGGWLGEEVLVGWM